MWEPYFKPTRRIHSSGFRCFECGYLQMDNRKAIKKVVVRRGVDNITNTLYFPRNNVEEIHMDLLLDGHIRLFSWKKRLWWSIPGWSDAMLTSESDDDTRNDKFIDEMYDKLNEGGKL